MSPAAHDPRFRFWCGWLGVAAYATIAFGLGLALGSTSAPVAALLLHPTNAIFWGAAAPDPVTVAYQGFVHGVLGATVAGWGVLMLAVARAAFRRRERWAWRAMAGALLAWFVPDTAISIAYAVWPNVALNVAVAALLGLPLVATRRAFGPETALHR